MPLQRALTPPNSLSETITITQKLTRQTITAYTSTYWQCVVIERATVHTSAVYSAEDHRLFSFTDSDPIDLYITHNIQRTDEGDTFADVFGLPPFDLNQCIRGRSYVNYFVAGTRTEVPELTHDFVASSH